MIDFYKFIESEQNSHEQQAKKTAEDEKPINILIKRINKQVINSPDLGLDFADIVKNLEK